MESRIFNVYNFKEAIDFYPIQSGFEVVSPAQGFGPMQTNNYLFHFILSGKGKYFQTSKDLCLELSKGQGFLIPPHTISSYIADYYNPWTYIWLEFNGVQAKQIIRKMGLSDNQLIYYSKNEQIIDELYQVFELLNGFNTSQAYGIIGASYLLLDKLIEYSMNQINSDNSISKHSQYVSQAISFIHNNYDSNISIDDISSAVNINTSYLSKIFKEETSFTLGKYLTIHRLKVAQKLLKETSMPISEISECINYSTQFNFSAAFKKEFGIPPSKWREENSN